MSSNASSLNFKDIYIYIYRSISKNVSTNIRKKVIILYANTLDSLSTLPFSTQIKYLYIWIWHKLGFFLIHNSNGVSDTDLEENIFNMCVVVRIAYMHAKRCSKWWRLNIDLIMSSKIRFLISSTPFCCGLNFSRFLTCYAFSITMTKCSLNDGYFINSF